MIPSFGGRGGTAFFNDLVTGIIYLYMTNYDLLIQSEGYQACKKVVEEIRGKTNPYEFKSNHELNELYETAKEWLDENERHEKYKEALKRFEQLEAEITKRQVKEFVL